MIITKRILTLKSKFGFGKYPDETIGRLIECDRDAYVRFAYYNFEEIDFTQEVKNEAKIYLSIEKPGISPDTGRANERKVWAQQKDMLGETKYMALCAQKMKTKRILEKAQNHIARLDGMSKGRLQQVNHGHGFINGK